LPSEVMELIRKKIESVRADMPPGYKLEIGGEEEEELKSFNEMTVVMIVSIISIFLCLVLQFKDAVKPLLVFAGVPYGILGALVGLLVMGQPFGFPAFMGVASLVGVIVSHVIVLFDFIEDGREHGMPLRDALLHASMVRLRPVLITVAATVLGFIPLAAHGGPLWQPLCYAQIGGLTFATFVTLGLVPIIYAICVLDLKVIKWSEPEESEAEAA
jgi:multidrug efflux pump subunit AcrB